MVQDIPEGTPKKPCNDNMILFVFPINEQLTFGESQKRAGRPFYKTVRCRYRAFSVAPSVLSADSSCNCKVGGRGLQTNREFGERRGP